MGMLATLLLSAVLTPQAAAKPSTPQWPDTGFEVCPTPASPQDVSNREWKYGQAERDDFEAAAKAKDYREIANLLAQFVQKYPDSDYRIPALLLEWAAYGNLKDYAGQVRVADDILRSPSAVAAAQAASFVTLTGLLSPHVHPGDAHLDRELSDLQAWTRCGRQASSAEIKPPNQSQEAFDNNRRYEGSIFDRTDGYVAFLRNDYGGAVLYLESARNANPQDGLTNLWLGYAKLEGDSPDLNGGVFYIARVAELMPDAPSGAELLRQVYVIVHGNDKGLDAVTALAKSNTVPPPGFSVLPMPTKERHYGQAFVGAVIVGLMVYAAIKAPGVLDSSSAGPGPSGASSESKIMIFGGPDHRTYLGLPHMRAVRARFCVQRHWQVR